MTNTPVPILSYCVIEDAVVFLDLPGDRYFRLSARANDLFVALRRGEPLEEEGRAVLEAAGVFAAGASAPDAPKGITLPVRQCTSVSEGEFRLSEIARAVWVQRRLEKRLQRRGIASVLRDIVRWRQASCSTRRRSPEGAAAVVRAFEQARVLRSPADKCLTRSLAIALCLARHGVHANVILAVKLGPFAAHAWAQAGGEVLNDTVEEVARYTPILVV
jgi:hypothetical protein